MKQGILLIQLGSPESYEVKDVKHFLKIFLSDPRVVDNQSLLWKIVLNLFILPLRAPKSALAYKKIYQDGTFPLLKYTEKFSKDLAEIIDTANYELEYSYIIGSPSVTEKLQALIDKGCTEIKVIPLFPQYCEATTLSCKDALDKAIKETSCSLKINFVESFHKKPSYINNLVANINNTLEKSNSKILLISFHGYPIRRIRNGDAYFQQCVETASLIQERVNLPKENIKLCFQSKFGREPWLLPATDTLATSLAKEHKNIAICCPSFLVDNLETEEEIALQLQEDFLKAGGEKIYLVPSLNNDSTWINDFNQELILEKNNEDLIVNNTIATVDQGCCHFKTHCKECPYKGMKKHPDESISPNDRTIIKSMFITLLLDIIGFSLLFPLFPALLKYYETQGSELFQYLTNTITNISQSSNLTSMENIALFGGVLTGLYSLLQFIGAPIIGKLSDKLGRRPLLLISITGICFSYLLWIVSKSFTLFIIARIIGGIMGSNITLASAVIADITSKKNRSKGMAFIGIAFGLGFTLGPVIGALSSLGDLSEYSSYLHPFSLAAIIAFSLSLYNLYHVYKNVPETLNKANTSDRTFNIFKLFKGENNNINIVIIAHFIFLCAFAGAETVLTFLTYQRLSYNSTDNGLMFLFIGIVLIFVQGGYVRRKANIIGEKKLSMFGLVLLIPSLVILAIGGTIQSSFVLYFALLLMAISSACIIPCLTALCSMYSTPNQQGSNLGTFRSFGALARALGPALAGIIYWKYSYQMPYYIAAIILIIPIMMLFLIKQKPSNSKR